MRKEKILWVLALVSLSGAAFLGSDNIKAGIEHALYTVGIISIITIICLPFFSVMKCGWER